MIELENSGIFWNVLGCYKRYNINLVDGHTNRLTDIRTCRAASLQLKSYPLPPAVNFDKYLFLVKVNATHLGWLSEKDLYAAIIDVIKFPIFSFGRPDLV